MPPQPWEQQVRVGTAQALAKDRAHVRLFAPAHLRVFRRASPSPTFFPQRKARLTLLSLLGVSALTGRRTSPQSVREAGTHCLESMLGSGARGVLLAEGKPRLERAKGVGWGRRGLRAAAGPVGQDSLPILPGPWGLLTLRDRGVASCVPPPWAAMLPARATDPRPGQSVIPVVSPFHLWGQNHL